MVSQSTGLNIINGGANGDTTSFMLQRIKGAFSHNPTHVLFLGGTNDAYWGQSLRAVADNTTKIFCRCHEHNVKLILGMPIPVDEPQIEALLAEYRALYLDLAAREGLAVIPFNKAFLNKENRFRVELTTDGCHPNIDGYEAMAEMAEKLLPELL
jgi:lysophospholipase L1-like esterase